MRTNLDHLPPQKQRELERVVQLIFEEFEDAFALAKHEWKKAGRILKVILYGSYARGTWVDEPHTAKGYRSDFDLLIIVSDKRLTDRVKYWAKLDERLMREYGVTGTLLTPVNFIVHTLQEVNDGLAHGRYFFMDVKQEGIAVYQSDDTELHTPKPKTPTQALAMATEYFEDWYPSAGEFFDDFRSNVDRSRFKKAAFELHQATERLYHGVLLVCTFYTPHNHNLAFLRTQAERIDSRLTYVWPRETKRDRTRFEKLKDAYVKARYSKHYRVTKEELEWLGAQVDELGRVVHAVCSERIDKLKADAKVRPDKVR
ncbi:HEPN domain-containing protein [Qipengyuania sp. SM2507]